MMPTPSESPVRNEITPRFVGFGGIALFFAFAAFAGWIGIQSSRTATETVVAIIFALIAPFWLIVATNRHRIARRISERALIDANRPVSRTVRIVQIAGGTVLAFLLLAGADLTMRVEAARSDMTLIDQINVRTKGQEAHQTCGVHEAIDLIPSMKTELGVAAVIEFIRQRKEGGCLTGDEYAKVLQEARPTYEARRLPWYRPSRAVVTLFAFVNGKEDPAILLDSHAFRDAK
jgi:hypothetical protein